MFGPFRQIQIILGELERSGRGRFRLVLPGRSRFFGFPQLGIEIDLFGEEGVFQSLLTPATLSGRPLARQLEPDITIGRRFDRSRPEGGTVVRFFTGQAHRTLWTRIHRHQFCATVFLGPARLPLRGLGALAESSTSLISLSLLTSKTTLLPSGTSRTSLSLPGLAVGLLEATFFELPLLPLLLPGGGEPVRSAASS